MKYNPRINEDACRLPGFARSAPVPARRDRAGRARADGRACRRARRGLRASRRDAAARGGRARRAHGALMCIRAAHTAAGDPRKKVIIPDTAHGTNPATVTMCGYETVTIPSDERGLVDLDALEGGARHGRRRVHAHEPQHARAVRRADPRDHRGGARGRRVRLLRRREPQRDPRQGAPRRHGLRRAAHQPAQDVLHAPRRGRPGRRARVRCASRSRRSCPDRCPCVLDDGGFELAWPEQSIGRVRCFYGNFGVLVRAYTYIRALGGEGLREVAEQAVLSANYLKERLEAAFDLPYDRTCMHEFVLSGARQKREHGVRTLDIAKRLLDYGFHPPTVYFPLLVEEALMIEPTETEPLSSLDAFADAMLAIAEEAAATPTSSPARRTRRRCGASTRRARRATRPALAPDRGVSADAAVWRLIVDGPVRRRVEHGARPGDPARARRGRRAAHAAALRLGAPHGHARAVPGRRRRSTSPRARRPGVDVVRRFTGGRGVLHDDEVTYSVVAARRRRRAARDRRVLPLPQRALVEAYRRSASMRELVPRDAGVKGVGRVLPAQHARRPLAARAGSSRAARRSGSRTPCCSTDRSCSTRDVEREAARLRLDEAIRGRLAETTATLADELGDRRRRPSEVTAAAIAAFEDALGVALEPVGSRRTNSASPSDSCGRRSR